MSRRGLNKRWTAKQIVDAVADGAVLCMGWIGKGDRKREGYWIEGKRIGMHPVESDQAVRAINSGLVEASEDGIDGTTQTYRKPRKEQA